MTDGTLTMILIGFKELFTEGVKNLQPYAISLMASLATIQVVYSQMMGLMEEKNPINILIQNILKIGLFVFFIENYTTLVDVVQRSFAEAGLIAGGRKITAQVATDPSYVSDMGGNLMEKIYTFTYSSVDATQSLPFGGIIAAATGELTVAKMFPNLFLMICAFALWVAFTVIAIQMFLTYLEFYISAALIPILLPWGVLKPTAWIAQKSFGAIVGAGVKIAVLVFVLSGTIPLIESWTLPQNATQAECMRLLAGSFAVAFLCWHAPSMAASIFSGVPGLGAGSVAGAVGAAVGGVMMGAGMVRAVSSGVLAGMKMYAGLSSGGGGTPDENIRNAVINETKIKP